MLSGWSHTTVAGVLYRKKKKALPHSSSEHDLLNVRKLISNGRCNALGNWSRALKCKRERKFTMGILKNAYALYLLIHK
jgi:hypothetical protein